MERRSPLVKVLVTPTSFTKDARTKATEMLEQFADEIIYSPYTRPLTATEIIPLLDGVDGYIAGLDDITAAVIEKAPASLKVISRYGAGYDRVDLDAAAQKGITVTNSPGVNSQAVADLTFGLMLAVARNIPALDRKVRNNEWPRFTGMELYQKTLGIIGLGEIGKNVAARAKGFAMNVIAYDPYIDPSYLAGNGIKGVPYDELIAGSDVITLHIPLNTHTKNMIDAASIAGMKPGTILINTARGGLIDEQAAYHALKTGKLGGLGLDAFASEPPRDSPLFELENVVATPHTGAHTTEAVTKMGLLSVQNLIDVLTGKKCNYILNM